MVYNVLNFESCKPYRLSPEETKVINKKILSTEHKDVPLTTKWLCHNFDFANEFKFKGNLVSRETFNSVCIDALKSTAGDYWVSYSRNNHQYYALKYGSMGYSILLRSIQTLLRAGFLKTVIPYANPHIEFQSVFKGNEKFLSAYGHVLLETGGIEHDETRAAVRLKRRGSRKFSPVPNNRFFQEMLAKINVHNLFLNQHDIKFNSCDAESYGSIRKIKIHNKGKEKRYVIDQAKSDLHRVFIDSDGRRILQGGEVLWSLLAKVRGTS